MTIPIQVEFHDMPWSDAVAAKVRERAEKLEHYSGDIMSCRVIVEPAHKRHHKGNIYRARVDVKLKGIELETGREPDIDRAHADVYVAIRDSFDAMRRRIEDYARRRRHDVKHHEEMPRGRIAEIDLDEGFGRIETNDGRLVYFHEHSVADVAFDKLAPGTEVRFLEEAGEHGPQATVVQVIGKH